jgi:hypothetical protein
MAVEISLKKGTANPTSGLTLAEPLFNSTNMRFHYVRSIRSHSQVAKPDLPNWPLYA